MKALFPQLIIKNYNEGVVSGKFEAVTLFLDLSGFTKMTEALMTHGKDGSEELSKILNSIFYDIVHIIYEYEGEISTFAGDACVAIFPKDKPLLALKATHEIQLFFINKNKYVTPFGNFAVAVKQGLSYGPVEWGIVESENILAYYFRGRAIDSCATAEHHCDLNQIVIDGILEKHLQKHDIYLKTKLIELEDTKKFLSLEEFSIEEGKTETTFPLVERQEASAELVQVFFPLLYERKNIISEFRDIASVFINFEELNQVDLLQEMVANALNQINILGGFLSSVDFGDKGCVMLAIFGAPLSHEDNIYRASRFAIELKNILKEKIRIGITAGPVYAGYVGAEIRKAYTVLGDVVNLSARLMGMANKGQVLINDNVFNTVYRDFKVDLIGTKQVKGKIEPVIVYDLLDLTVFDDSNIHSGIFIGRTKELQLLKIAFEPFVKKNFGGFHVLLGDTGVGKSRLLYEYILPYEGVYNVVVLQTDAIYHKSLNSFISFFYNYFDLRMGMSPEEKKERLNNKIQTFPLLARKISEFAENLANGIVMKQSILGALLGIRWENSLYEEIHPKDRFSHYASIIKVFFEFITLLIPVVLVVEDAVNMDEDTKKVLNSLEENFRQSDTNIIIFIISRLYDNGEHPVFLNTNKVFEKKILLVPLSDEEAISLAETILEGSIDLELRKFILTKTQNNPFYISQVCNYLVHHNLIETEGSHKVLSSQDLILPPSIRSILVARLDRLSEDLKSLVQKASVLGREFHIDILHEIIDIDKDTLHLLLEKGCSEHIWKIKDGSLAVYTFIQSLLCEAAYEMQLTDNQKLIHSQIAEKLSLYSHNKEYVYQYTYSNVDNYIHDIAFHYHKSNDINLYHQYLLEASVHDKEAILLKSIEHYHRYLSSIDLLNHPSVLKDEFINIHSRIASIFISRFKIDLAMHLLDNFINNIIKNSQSYTQDTDFTKRLLPLKIQLAEIYIKQKKLKTAYLLLQSLLKYSALFEDLISLSRSSLFLGHICLYNGDYSDADMFFYRAMSISDYDSSLEPLCLYYMGVLERHKGNYREAKNNLILSKDGFTKNNSKECLFYPEYELGVIHYKNNEFEEAYLLFKKILEYYKSIDDIVWVAKSLEYLALIEVEKGYHSTALAYTQEAMSMAIITHEWALITSLFSTTAIIYYKMGNKEECFSYLQQAFESMKDVRYVDLYVTLLSYLTCQYAFDGESS